MEKTIKYTEGNVSVTISPNGAVAFNQMAYAGRDVGDLYTLLSNGEVIEALGLGPDLNTAAGLEALPVGARVVDADEDTHQKDEDGGWRIVRWSYDACDRTAPGIVSRSSDTLMSFGPLTLDEEDN